MKKLLSILLTATLFFSSMLPVFAGNINVNIDQHPVVYTEQSGAPFLDSSSRTQVPFRKTMETFGAAVSWNQTTQVAIAQIGKIKVEVPIGQKYIVKNGQQIPNDTAALIKDGHTYLPIRAVLEAFNAQVTWNNISGTVVVSTIPSISDITVHFINVGQGDSILIDSGNVEILIDAGPKSASATVVNYIKPYINGNLEAVVATHEHEDHIGGLPAILANYNVEKVIDNGRTANTKIYNEYLCAVNAEDCTHLVSSRNQNVTVVLGNNAVYRTLSMSGAYKDPNNNSVVSLLEYGNVKGLFMGDMEQPAEKSNLDIFMDTDFLKAGHHGSKTASSTEFLNRTMPETVIVSAGTGNTYKHPHLAAMQRFASIGAKTYGTFNSGTIVLTTNGVTYSLDAQTQITVHDAGDISNIEAMIPPERNANYDNSELISYYSIRSCVRMMPANSSIRNK